MKTNLEYEIRKLTDYIQGNRVLVDLDPLILRTNKQIVRPALQV